MINLCWGDDVLAASIKCFNPRIKCCAKAGSLSRKNVLAQNFSCSIIPIITNTSKLLLIVQRPKFLGPRGPLELPSFVRPPVRKKNLDQLYSSINHHRTTANLSDIVWIMSGGVWWCMDYVWWCLVVSDACLVVSGGVNVYRLIWPELSDVYGQISLQCM